jgi:hypothetical protein
MLQPNDAIERNIDANKTNIETNKVYTETNKISKETNKLNIEKVSFYSERNKNSIEAYNKT